MLDEIDIVSPVSNTGLRHFWQIDLDQTYFRITLFIFWECKANVNIYTQVLSKHKISGRGDNIQFCCCSRQMYPTIFMNRGHILLNCTHFNIPTTYGNKVGQMSTINSVSSGRRQKYIKYKNVMNHSINEYIRGLLKKLRNSIVKKETKDRYS